MSRRRCNIAAVLISLVALVGPSMQVAAEESRMERTVTVSATGTAIAVPDTARISTGVLSEAATAREALTANNTAMAKLIAALKENGIEAHDIQTSGFNLNPRYTNPREGQPAVIDGYQAANQVTVHVRNLDKMGEVLDKLVSIGANQMNGITFEVSTAETLRDAARKEAIVNARRRAELFAAAAGVKVGKVVSITEGAMVEPRPFFKAGRVAAMEAVPVERGTQSLEATVTVTWELD